MGRRSGNGAGATRLEQIPERLLAALWKERAARLRSFRSKDGRTFRVIYPGRASTTAGPDFRDAVLVEEGLGVVRGDVEIHVTHGDWRSHGHAGDPRYNGVVLHAVGGPGGEDTVLRSGQRAPVVSLDTLWGVRGGVGTGTGIWALMGGWGYAMPETAQELGALLDRAGDDRYLSKSGRYGEALATENPDQLLYSAFMEALGYSQNRGPFLDLAARVTCADLDCVCAGLEGPRELPPLRPVSCRRRGSTTGRAPRYPRSPGTCSGSALKTIPAGGSPGLRESWSPSCPVPAPLHRRGRARAWWGARSSCSGIRRSAEKRDVGEPW